MRGPEQGNVGILLSSRNKEPPRGLRMIERLPYSKHWELVGEFTPDMILPSTMVCPSRRP